VLVPLLSNRLFRQLVMQGGHHRLPELFGSRCCLDYGQFGQHDKETSFGPFGSISLMMRGMKNRDRLKIRNAGLKNKGGVFV
jgi:hypothetical protein